MGPIMSAKHTAPEINRIAVKLHGPISPPVRAKRANMELAAKAIIAKAVRENIRSGVVEVIGRPKSDMGERLVLKP